MKVLVTGGGGFVGSAVARRLVARGDHVRSLSRGGAPGLERLGVEVLRGDVADADVVSKAVAGCDGVIHTAALAGVWGRREDYERTNVLGTSQVISACRARGCQLLVHTSSPSVVFDGSDQEGVDEKVPYPGRYLAHYPRTKAEAERLVLAADSDALRTVALRPHLVWGPGDRHLVPRVLERGRTGKLRRVRSTGGPSKLVDSTFIDNAAEAHVLALDQLATSGAPRGRAYFISNGEPIPMDELLGRILEAGGLPRVERSISARAAWWVGAALEAAHGAFRLRSEPPLTRFVARQLATAHWFDLGAARRDLGYVPRVSLSEGFERLRVWLAESTSPRGEERGRHAAG